MLYEFSVFCVFRVLQNKEIKGIKHTIRVFLVLHVFSKQKIVFKIVSKQVEVFPHRNSSSLCLL